MSGQIIYRSGNRYTQEEKFAIVKDYLESNLSRNANERPHLSLNYMTPKYVHDNPNAYIRPCWKNYYPKASQRDTVAMN